MSFSRVRPAGLWILGSTIDPGEIEALDRDHALAVDGRGGTYAPADPLVIGGDGVDLSGANHALSGTLTVQSLGSLTVADGGRVRLNGTGSGSVGKIDLRVTSGVALIVLNDGTAIQVLDGGSADIFGALVVKDGGVATVNDGGAVVLQDGAELTLQDGAVATVADGAQLSVAGQLLVTTDGSVTLSGAATVLGGASSTVTLQGENNLSSLTLVGADVWPELATARTVTRPAVRAIPLSFNDGAGSVGPDDPDMWECKSGLSSAPAFRSRNAAATGRASILEVPDLPIGSVITGAEIDSRGTEAANVTSTLPTYQIVSWSSGEGGLASHSTATSDAGVALTFGATTTTTTVGNSGDAASRTVTDGRRYGILVTHPYQSGSAQGVWVYRCNILASAESIQV